MACIEHKCKNCEAQFMDNKNYTVCPICKSSGIMNWFDEESELMSLEELEASKLEDDDD